MVYLIVIILGILIISSFTGNKKEKQVLGYIPKRKNKPIGIYQNERVMMDLAGVHYRIDVYKEIKEGDQLIVQFDHTNEYDKNAIGVYTKNGKLAGYIPRNQRKVIKTLRVNPNVTALVIQKKKDNDYYRITVELWVGNLYSKKK